MSIKVDQEKCIGCGACASICPEAFEINSDGKSQALVESSACAQQAADACPVQAITVSD